MTLAIAFTAFGWLGLDTSLRAVETPAIDISSSTSSRSSYVVLAADRQVAEISSPSDVAPTPAQAGAIPGHTPTPTPFNAMQGQDLATVHGFRSPLPFGPSGTPFLLQYMTCDPHSCPNIWQGYDAQRAADLAKKCSPPGGGSCGAGFGCGRNGLHNAPCMTCASGPIKSVNRYRPAPVSSPACNSCGKVGCDGLSSDSINASCSSCQAAMKTAESERLSGVPTPAIAR